MKRPDMSMRFLDEITLQCAVGVAMALGFVSQWLIGGPVWAGVAGCLAGVLHARVRLALRRRAWRAWFEKLPDGEKAIELDRRIRDLERAS